LKAYDDICVRVYRESEKECAVLSLETLVAEILPSSIPAEFEGEALRAQAVVMRTNIARQLPVYNGRGCDVHPGADICDTGHCLRWMSRIRQEKVEGDKKGQNWERIIRAVDSTRGEIIVVKDRPVIAYFHECCGGATENSENITGNRMVYLRKVLCDYCKDSAAWENERDLSLEEIEERLDIRADGFVATKGSPIEGFIEDIDRDSEGRIRSIRIGGKYFKGTDAKDLLGLTSTRFGWRPVTLRFISGGKGHGLGMCQYGAAAMAREGSSYRDIINYYFTGVDITAVKGGSGTPLAGKVFVLDPGHGGDDGDNTGPGGLKEKDVNLDIALRLEKMLEEAGAKVFLTRRKDTGVLLSDRTDMANKTRPHFFISIHQNGFFNPVVSGTEIYYYNGDAEGERMGRCIMERLVEEAGALDKGVKTANFFVLREAKVSSLQLELFYITNPREEKRLEDSGFRERVARAVSNGIMSYYRYSAPKQR
jgi:stage II sporulation protein D